MSTEHAFPGRRVAVRWPFRVLATLLCAAALVAMGGMAYALYDGRVVATDRIFVRLIVGVPGMLWLLRVAAHATLHGTTPGEQPSWPFASERVMYAYIVLAAVIVWSVAS